MIVLFVPFLAQAYTGITIVVSAQTQTNQEFIDTIKTELAGAKSANLRVKVVELQESDKLVVAENSVKKCA
jgi:putative ABC transport system substrate-binding protein